MWSEGREGGREGWVVICQAVSPRYLPTLTGTELCHSVIKTSLPVLTHFTLCLKSHIILFLTSYRFYIPSIIFKFYSLFSPSRHDFMMSLTQLYDHRMQYNVSYLYIYRMNYKRRTLSELSEKFESSRCLMM